MKEHHIFTYITHKLPQLMNRKPKDTQMQKLRDLFIGIVLNLSCNLETQSTIVYMIKEADIIEILMKILQDFRHDWPTNGSALALL